MNMRCYSLTTSSTAFLSLSLSPFLPSSPPPFLFYFPFSSSSPMLFTELALTLIPIHIITTTSIHESNSNATYPSSTGCFRTVGGVIEAEPTDGLHRGALQPQLHPSTFGDARRSGRRYCDVHSEFRGSPCLRAFRAGPFTIPSTLSALPY